MTRRVRYVLVGSISAPALVLVLWLGVWRDVTEFVPDIPGEIVPWEQVEADIVTADSIAADIIQIEVVDEEAADDVGRGAVAEGRFIARRQEIHATRLTDVGDYPAVEAPAFYVALGQFRAEARPRTFRHYLASDERPLLVFTGLGHNWRRKYRRVLSIVPLAVCVLDFAPAK